MTVGISASTHLAATVACVLQGSCYLQTDGVVNVSITNDVHTCNNTVTVNFN